MQLFALLLQGAQPPHLFDQVMTGLKEQQFVSMTTDDWTKTQGSEHVLNLMPHVMAVHPEAERCQVDVAGRPDDGACWHAGGHTLIQTNKHVERSIKQTIFCCCMLGNHQGNHEKMEVWFPNYCPPQLQTVFCS